jgi:hypothetical protein
MEDIIKQTSLDLKERFAKCEVQLKEKEIIEKLEQLVKKFHVPIAEARRNVTNHFLRIHNIKQDAFFSAAGYSNQTPVKIDKLTTDGKWCTFNARLSILWEPQHEKILQTGVVGDETGTMYPLQIKW